MLNYVSPLIKDDETFIKLKWKLRMNYPLNLENPQTFSEKLQWLKLHDRRPEYTRMVDKVEAKKYVAELIGEQYIIPTLGVWNSPDEIDFDSLPNQFVLKCNHNSGEGMYICKDKSQMNRSKVVDGLRKALKRNYYWISREWPYKNVRRRIIAEQYMTDDGVELKDYKVFIFNGEPRIIAVDYNRFHGHLRNIYTTEWEKIDAIINDFQTDCKRVFEKPKVLEEMLSLSRKLAAGLPHVRTDFYIVNDKIYFGELTLYHAGGFVRTTPGELNLKMGKWTVLP